MMLDIAPILHAPLLIQTHLIAALSGLAIGGVQVWGVRMGRTAHRVLGWSFVAAMAVTAVSAFFIRTSTGGFSLIHIFIPFTIVGVSAGMLAIRRGDVRTHRSGMRWFYFAGLSLAGALAFLPGRVLHAAVFG